MEWERAAFDHTTGLAAGWRCGRRRGWAAVASRRAGCGLCAATEWDLSAWLRFPNT